MNHRLTIPSNFPLLNTRKDYVNQCVFIIMEKGYGPVKALYILICKLPFRKKNCTNSIQSISTVLLPEFISLIKEHLQHYLTVKLNTFSCLLTTFEPLKDYE